MGLYDRDYMRGQKRGAHGSSRDRDGDDYGGNNSATGRRWVMIAVVVVIVAALGWGFLNRLAWQVAMPWMMAQQDFSDYPLPKLLESQTIDLGEFAVESGEVVLCDPSYNPKLVRTGGAFFKVANVLPGPWRAKVVRYTIDAPDYVVCAELLAFPASRPLPPSPDWQKTTVEINMDSGLAAFADASHFRPKDAVPADYVWKGPMVAPQDPWYSLCCDVTQNSPNAGILPHGVVCTTGWGDGGSYPAYVLRDEQGKVVGLRMQFILPDEVEAAEKPGIKPELEIEPAPE